MKKILMILILFSLESCKDKGKQAEQKKQAYADSARTDSIKAVELKQQNNETDKIIADSNVVNRSNWDSVFTGKKRHLHVPASKNKL